MRRKDLIDLLLDRPLSVSQLAGLLRQTPRDVENDLTHLLRSLTHTAFGVAVTPARCRKCGFVFSESTLHKPSKCPECRSTWLSEPRVATRRKPPPE
jgi:hypothetical protein